MFLTLTNQISMPVAACMPVIVIVIVLVAIIGLVEHTHQRKHTIEHSLEKDRFCLVIDFVLGK